MREQHALQDDPIVVESIRTNAELEAELADAHLLQRLSTELFQEDGTQGLYKKIVQAAVAIMRSQYASMQMLYPDPGKIGKLRLLASSGFSPEAEKFWEWVYKDTGSSCGAALRAEKRAIISNFATCEYMQDKPTLPLFLESGIFAAQSTPLFSRNGRLLGMISTHWNYPHQPSERHLRMLDVLARQAADLIERAQHEEALRESEERLRALTIQLEERVQDRTKELQRSNEDLQQFAHVASHDLKEPVRKIQTFGFRLRDLLKNSGHENEKMYIEKVLESANRMATMIEGVLTYSSISTVAQEFGMLNLDRLMDNICNDLEIVIQQKGATIQYSNLPQVEGIEVLLYQLFYNLINNSLKFSKESEKPLITITSQIEKINGVTCARIVVADNGIGFEPEFNNTIFHNFTRLNSKSMYDGTGLGLSLARKVAERHHGSIEAVGKLNEGAILTVILPLKQPTGLSEKN